MTSSQSTSRVILSLILLLLFVCVTLAQDSSEEQPAVDVSVDVGDDASDTSSSDSSTDVRTSSTSPSRDEFTNDQWQVLYGIANLCEESGVDTWEACFQRLGGEGPASGDESGSIGAEAFERALSVIGVGNVFTRGVIAGRIVDLLDMDQNDLVSQEEFLDTMRRSGLIGEEEEDESDNRPGIEDGTDEETTTPVAPVPAVDVDVEVSPASNDTTTNVDTSS